MVVWLVKSRHSFDRPMANGEISIGYRKCLRFLWRWTLFLASAFADSAFANANVTLNVWGGKCYNNRSKSTESQIVDTQNLNTSSNWDEIICVVCGHQFLSWLPNRIFPPLFRSSHSKWNGFFVIQCPPPTLSSRKKKTDLKIVGSK